MPVVIDGSMEIRLIVIIVLAVVAFEGSTGYPGREFIVGFLDNRLIIDTSICRLYITSLNSSDLPLEVTVTLPGWDDAPLWPSSIGRPFTEQTYSLMTAGDVIEVDFPYALAMSGTNIENKGVYILTSGDVTVRAASVSDWSTDAYVALPVSVVGSQYYVITYLYDGPPTVYKQGPSEFGVIATSDGTQIVIRLTSDKITIGDPGEDVTQSGLLLTLTLDKFETYQLQSSSDLSGTSIKSSQPVIVLSGAQWTAVTNSPQMGSHLIEQLTPVEMWGTIFLTTPIVNRLYPDVFRVIASTNNTLVNIDWLIPTTSSTSSSASQSSSSSNGVSSSGISKSATSTVVRLNEAGVYEFTANFTNTNVRINSSCPILLIQLCRAMNANSTGGQRLGAPVMTVVPPVNMFSMNYTFTTLLPRTPTDADMYVTFLNLIADTSVTSDVIINGLSLSTEDFYNDWSVVGDTGVSTAVLALTAGTVYCVETRSMTAFGGILYGFRTNEAYAMPLGVFSVSQSIEYESLVFHAPPTTTTMSSTSTSTTTQQTSTTTALTTTDQMTTAAEVIDTTTTYIIYNVTSYTDVFTIAYNETFMPSNDTVTVTSLINDSDNGSNITDSTGVTLGPLVFTQSYSNVTDNATGKSLENQASDSFNVTVCNVTDESVNCTGNGTGLQENNAEILTGVATSTIPLSADQNVTAVFTNGTDVNQTQSSSTTIHPPWQLANTTTIPQNIIADNASSAGMQQATPEHFSSTTTEADGEGLQSASGRAISGGRVTATTGVASTNQGPSSSQLVIILASCIGGGIPLITLAICLLCAAKHKFCCCRKLKAVRRMSAKVDPGEIAAVLGMNNGLVSTIDQEPASGSRGFKTKESFRYEGGYIATDAALPKATTETATQEGDNARSRPPVIPLTPAYYQPAMPPAILGLDSETSLTQNGNGKDVDHRRRSFDAKKIGKRRKSNVVGPSDQSELTEGVTMTSPVATSTRSLYAEVPLLISAPKISIDGKSAPDELAMSYLQTVALPGGQAIPMSALTSSEQQFTEASDIQPATSTSFIEKAPTTFDLKNMRESSEQTGFMLSHVKDAASTKQPNASTSEPRDVTSPELCVAVTTTWTMRASTKILTVITGVGDDNMADSLNVNNADSVSVNILNDCDNGADELFENPSVRLMSTNGSKEKILDNFNSVNFSECVRSTLTDHVHTPECAQPNNVANAATVTNHDVTTDCKHAYSVVSKPIATTEYLGPHSKHVDSVTSVVAGENLSTAWKHDSVSSVAASESFGPDWKHVASVSSVAVDENLALHWKHVDSDTSVVAGENLGTEWKHVGSVASVAGDNHGPEWKYVTSFASLAADDNLNPDWKHVDSVASVAAADNLGSECKHVASVASVAADDNLNPNWEQVASVAGVAAADNLGSEWNHVASVASVAAADNPGPEWKHVSSLVNVVSREERQCVNSVTTVQTTDEDTKWNYTESVENMGGDNVATWQHVNSVGNVTDTEDLHLDLNHTDSENDITVRSSNTTCRSAK